MVHEPHEPHERLLHSQEVFRIQGAVFEVNRRMGSGFLEAVYQECLALEFAERQIPYVAAPAIGPSYRGIRLKRGYAPDFICFESMIVELKAVREFAPEHRAQVLNYLRAANLRIGLLVNFGCAPKARIERFIL